MTDALHPLQVNLVIPGISIEQEILRLSPSGPVVFDTTDSSQDISSAELCVASSILSVQI